MIAANKVLTAGHCSQENASTYFVIPQFYSFNDTVTETSLFTVSRVADHPQYNDFTLENDVGVLTLSRSSNSPMLSVFDNGSDLTDKDATVIGTGLTSTQPQIAPDVLQEVDTPIISNELCNDIWQSFAGIEPVTPEMVCAGFLTDGRGSCSGDSGGPLIANINNSRVIVGTVSFGFTTCEAQRANSVYARMSAVSDFIRAESPNTEFVSLSSGAIIGAISLLLLSEEQANESIPATVE